MKFFVFLFLFSVAYCLEIISKDVSETLKKVAKWHILPYEENPMRYRSRESFEKDLKYSFNFDNPSIQIQENSTIGEQIIQEIEEINLFKNNTDNKCLSELISYQKCSKVNAIKAVLKTMEYVRCALEGVEIKYNPWGNIIFKEDTLTCSNKILEGCDLSHDIISLYNMELWEETSNKSINYDNQDFNGCVPFCVNLNNPITILDRLNITKKKGNPFQLMKEGHLVSLDSKFSIYEDMLYYKDGIYSYVLGEEIFKSFFIAYGYKKDKLKTLIYGFTFIPGRGIVRLNLLYDDFFESNLSVNNSTFITIKKKNI